MLAKKCLVVLLAGLPLLASAAVPAAAEVSILGSMAQVVLALGAVLGLIFASAWLARRFSLLPRAAGGQMRVVSGLMVGQRERVVIVEVRDQWLILGVTAQNVSLLSSMPRPADAEVPEVAMPPFAQWLTQAMQKRSGKSSDSGDQA